MNNLSDKIGLEVELLESNQLKFGSNVEVEEVSARTFLDLLPVASDSDIEAKDEPAYLMYRSVRKVGDEEKIAKAGLRFDITVIPPGKLGDEYIKTFGHYHPKKPNTETTYPEMYQVIQGQATYLMQKKDQDGKVVDAIISRVGEGETIVIPCGYGHVTINKTDETLVMANWVAGEFASSYQEYEKNQGASHYLKDKNGSLDIIKNEKYGDVSDLREMSPVLDSLLGESVVRRYQFVDNIDKLRFLVEPQEFQSKLTVEKLFG